LDWEYPAQRGGNTYSDKENFVLLLAELKRILGPQGKLIAVAAGATQKSASISYDIEKFVEHVDFVNLMAYDMHGSWEPFTGLKEL
jgi:chitinase